jgi:hypothetical protein
MTEYHFSDEEYNNVIKETEEIKLARIEAEAKKSRERDEAIRTFECLSRRIESEKSWFDIPPPRPSPSPVSKAKGKDKDKDERDKDNHKIAQFIQKYSAPSVTAESVIVGNIPYFAIARINDDDDAVNIMLEDFVPITDSIEYRPFGNESYLNKPYTFKSREEFDLTIEKAKCETLDSLYRKVMSIWKKYIDADDFHISICAADTLFTYFQDKIGMTYPPYRPYRP